MKLFNGSVRYCAPWMKFALEKGRIWNQLQATHVGSQRVRREDNERGGGKAHKNAFSDAFFHS